MNSVADNVQTTLAEGMACERKAEVGEYIYC